MPDQFKHRLSWSFRGYIATKLPTDMARGNQVFPVAGMREMSGNARLNRSYDPRSIQGDKFQEWRLLMKAAAGSRDQSRKNRALV